MNNGECTAKESSGARENRKSDIRDSTLARASVHERVTHTVVEKLDQSAVFVLISPENQKRLIIFCYCLCSVKFATIFKIISLAI